MKDRTKDFEALEAAFRDDPSSFRPGDGPGDATVESLIAKRSWATSKEFRAACATPFLGHGLLLRAAQLTNDPPAYRKRAIALCKGAMTNLPKGRYASPWWRSAMHYVALIALCQWQALADLTADPPESDDVFVAHALAKLLARIRLHGYHEDHLSPAEWGAIDQGSYLRQILAFGRDGFSDPVNQAFSLLQSIDVGGSSPIANLIFELSDTSSNKPIATHHEYLAMMCSVMGTQGEDNELDDLVFHSLAQNRITESIVLTNPFFYSVMIKVASEMAIDEHDDDDEEIDEDDGDEGLDEDHSDDEPLLLSLADVKAFAKENQLDVDLIVDRIRSEVDLECGCEVCTANRRILMEADAEASARDKPGGIKAGQKAGSAKPTGRIWRPSR